MAERTRRLILAGVAALLVAGCDRGGSQGGGPAASFKGIDITGAEYARSLALPDAAGTPQGSNRLHHSMNALRQSLAPILAVVKDADGKDASITAYRHVLLEWDTGTKEEQRAQEKALDRRGVRKPKPKP